MGLKGLFTTTVGYEEGNADLEFRISVLNFTLYVAGIFSILFALLHDLGINDITRFHSLVDYAYALCSFFLILLLRRSRGWFPVVAPVFIVLSIICFTSALILVISDEFRLIWFYFVIYVTYVLLSERAGLIVTGICLLIVLLCALTVDLHMSKSALLTGMIGMFVVSLLSRTYTMQLLRYESQLGEKNKELMHSVHELDEALASAWEANRAKSLFLANMSHEIRTPMNGVLGMTQVMKGTALDQDQAHYVDAIHRAGKNLLVLIDDLLDISRIESGKLEIEAKPFATFDWVMDIQFITEPLFEESAVAYTTEVYEKVPDWLMGDSARLTQIVTNLVSNAAKFTKEGEVRLTIGGEMSSTDRYCLKIEVKDTGIGIPEEMLASVFEPFEQVNPERIANKGVGLGLAISKRLALAMGGDLTAISEGNRGSCFNLEVELPVVDSVRRIEPSGNRNSLGRLLRILLVDDDRINRLAAYTLLKQLKHEVVEAENGEEAIACLHNQEKFDVVLMDVHMPVMDGVTATQIIRSDPDPHVASIPIFGLTASVMTDEKERYLAAGMNAVVQKPIVLEQLIDVIRDEIPCEQGVPSV